MQTRDYTTEFGVKITLLPIPELLAAQITESVTEGMREEGFQLDVPTYTTELVGGGEETREHDEESIQDELTAAEDRAKWKRYEQAVEERARRTGIKLLDMMLLRGTKVELPADNDWIEQQKFLGIRVPDDPTLRKLHYLKTEV